VVWSAHTGDTTQIVYKSLRGHGGRVLEKERIVYTTKGSVDQVKVVTFDPQGNLKVRFDSSPARQAGQKGRLARLSAAVTTGYVLLRPASGAGAVVAVVDRTLQPVQDRFPFMPDDAMAGPKLRLTGPIQRMERVAIADLPTLTGRWNPDQAVGKLLMQQMLYYSTWSAAPPSAEGNTAVRFPAPAIPACTDPSLVVHSTASRSAVVPSGPDAFSGRSISSIVHVTATGV
jgi:hypothetical protein